MMAGLSSFLSRHVLDRRGGHRARVLDGFAQRAAFDTLAPADRERYRRERLAALINHARARTAWWADRLARQPPATVENSMDMLRELPVLTRADVQAHGASMVVEGAETLPDATGGSSGTPMRFRVDWATQAARESSLMWADSLAGWQPGRKIAMLWGSDRDISLSLRNSRLLLRWWIENRRWYNAFDMGPAQMAEYHRRLAAFQPWLLVGYAGSLDVFARYLQEQGHRPAYPRGAVISSAECLPEPVRRRVTEVFGRPVFDRYGNREFGAIAAECAHHTGLHVNERDCIVEIDSPDPARAPGRLLVTYLNNFAMPFIRYDTGDLARWSEDAPCCCGRATQRLAAVTGRVSDSIRTAAGRIVHGEYFTHLLYGYPMVKEFQFVQLALRDYVLRYVAEAELGAAEAEGLRTAIRQQVGSDSRVAVERVALIPVLPSGKRKFTLALTGSEAESGP